MTKKDKSKRSRKLTREKWQGMVEEVKRELEARVLVIQPVGPSPIEKKPSPPPAPRIIHPAGGGKAGLLLDEANLNAVRDGMREITAKCRERERARIASGAIVKPTIQRLNKSVKAGQRFVGGLRKGPEPQN